MTNASAAYGRGGGIVGGVPSPIRMAGTSLGPHWTVDGDALTTTATRLYYYPIWIDRIETWLGVKTSNTGAGDNTKTYRVGIYKEAATGGPGALGKDFGEVTLTGAAALRTLTSSWTPDYIGWHYLCTHQSAVVTGMDAFNGLYLVTSAGWVNPPLCQAFGTLETAGGVFSGPSVYPFMYVDTAYGALASTAVAPTNAVTSAPAIRLYK